MSRPLRIQYPGAFYHVACRGNEKKEIFRDDEDRAKFLAILKSSQKIYQVEVYAWVLMKNHFHLLLETPLGNLDQFMRRFNITYTGYFNRKYQRVGHLYQGRYKSLIVEKETYLSELSRYIHLNPIRTKAMTSKTSAEKMKILAAYPWSTLKSYIDQNKKLDGVDYSLILAEFGGDNPTGRRGYRKRIKEDISGKLELGGKVLGGSILGSEEFIQWIKEGFFKSGLNREYSGSREITRYKAREEILQHIMAETGKTLEELKSAKGDLRRMAMELLYRKGGLKGEEIGKIFEVSYNAVSQERKRLIVRIAGDLELRRKFEAIAGKLGH